MPDPVVSYYQAALAGLRFVEARRPSGRRFGENADALWKGFAGELSTADRLDVLIRDADAEWPGAFGARTVFGRSGAAEDEPFGVGWQRLGASDAEELWRDALKSQPPADVEMALRAAAQAWGLSLSAFDPGDIGSAERLAVVGPSAIAAVIARFAQSRELGWAEQVVVVATPESHRQLAALGPALVNVNKTTRLVNAREAETENGAARRLLISTDADGADRAAAEKAFGGG